MLMKVRYFQIYFQGKDEKTGDCFNSFCIAWINVYPV